jgi:hypothetical protein
MIIKFLSQECQEYESATMVWADSTQHKNALDDKRTLQRKENQEKDNQKQQNTKKMNRIMY